MTPEPAPALATDEALDEILAEWLEAVESGTAPQLPLFLARYPKHAAQLEQHLADWQQFQQWTTPLRKVLHPADAETLSTSETGTFPAVLSFPEYELLEELGRGGGGIVYRARQRSLDRVVALKVLRSGALDSPEEARRFQNEAALLAQLDHSNLVPIYEVGACDSQPYFTMKLVSGGSLLGQLPRFRDNAQATARLLAVAARAVHHAHQRGILHRDLKPSNILLDRDGQPHVTDFGLARQLEKDSDLTQSGAIVGTPSYMAPEQALGRRDAVTTATDVYGLGAVLYALLTGRPPFLGSNMLETICQVREKEPDPPSLSSPQVNRDLQTICLKCLEKDPRRRYPSAAALAEDLERFLAGEPIAARRSSIWERARKWARRRPTAAALVAVSLLAIAAAVIGLLVYTQNLNQALGVSNQLRKEGLEREANLRRHLYVPDMLNARRAWEYGEPGRALELLEKYLPKEGEEDLRGFEWHYLNAACRVAPQRLGEHATPIYGMAVSPDERWVATADTKGIIKIWDVAAGKEVRHLTTVEKEIHALAFSPDGRLLASGGQELGIRLWDTSTWTEKRRLIGFEHSVCTLAFSPDSTRLASVHISDKIVRLWHLNGFLPTRCKGHTGDVQRVVWSPDGSWFASSGVDRTLRLWDGKTGNELATLPTTHGSSIPALSCSPDGALLATAELDGKICLWDVSPQALQALRGGTSPGPRATLEGNRTMKTLAFTRDGRLLLAAGRGGIISLIAISADRFELRLHRILRDGGRQLRGASFVQQDRSFVTASEDGTVKLWNLEALLGEEMVAQANLLVSSGDGKWGLVRAPAGELHLHDRATGQRVARLEGVMASPGPGAFSPRSTFVAVGDAAGHVVIWDVATRKLLVNITETMGIITHPEFFPALAFSPSEELLAAGEANRIVRIWESRTGKLRATLKPEGNPPQRGAHHLCFSSDGCTLYTAAHQDGEPLEIHFWDLGANPPERRKVLHVSERADLLHSLVLSPDDRQLAVATGDRVIELWDVEANRRRGMLIGHIGKVERLAFSPDSKTLASTATDGTLKLWHCATMQELFTFTSNWTSLYHLVFAADGRSLNAQTISSQGESRLVRWGYAAENKPLSRHEVP